MLCYVTRPDSVVMEVEVDAKANGEDCLNKVGAPAARTRPGERVRRVGRSGGSPGKLHRQLHSGSGHFVIHVFRRRRRNSVRS